MWDKFLLFFKLLLHMHYTYICTSLMKFQRIWKLPFKKYIRHYTSPTFAVLYTFGFLYFLTIISYLKCGLTGVLSAYYQHFAFCWLMLKLRLLGFKIVAWYIPIVLFIHLFTIICETVITTFLGWDLCVNCKIFIIISFNFVSQFVISIFAMIYLKFSVVKFIA